jgi:chitinase
MYTNAVYFPNYRVYRGDTPAQLNYDCINHVYYAFATVSPDGGVFVSLLDPVVRCLSNTLLLQLSDEWADAQAPCDGVEGALGSLMHLKQRHPHLSVILSIGGAGSPDVFPVVASDPILRDNFARSALGLVEASGLDGIDSM